PKRRLAITGARTRLHAALARWAATRSGLNNGAIEEAKGSSKPVSLETDGFCQHPFAVRQQGCLYFRRASVKPGIGHRHFESIDAHRRIEHGGQRTDAWGEFVTRISHAFSPYRGHLRQQCLTRRE